MNREKGDFVPKSGRLAKMFVDGKDRFQRATRLPRALGVPRNVAMMIFHDFAFCL